MSEKVTGGPAFPCAVTGWPGMELRDYFAGQALITAMCSDNSTDERMADECAMQIARRCYELADAMLKAREAM